MGLQLEIDQVWAAHGLRDLVELELGRVRFRFDSSLWLYSNTYSFTLGAKSTEGIAGDMGESGIANLFLQWQNDLARRLLLQIRYTGVRDSVPCTLGD